MKSARTFNGLSTQIFLWFWFILLLVVAAVVILPTLDPRNIIPLPAHEITRLNNNLGRCNGARIPSRISIWPRPSMPRASCRWTTSIYAMPRGRCSPAPG